MSVNDKNNDYAIHEDNRNHDQFYIQYSLFYSWLLTDLRQTLLQWNPVICWYTGKYFQTLENVKVFRLHKRKSHTCDLEYYLWENLL